MQKTNIRPVVPFALASAMIMAPMLAYGQAAQQSTQPPAAQSLGGQTQSGTAPMQQGTMQQPTTPQGVTPGQPAPPSAGLSPGMTPGGAVGEMPDRTTGTNRQTQVPGGQPAMTQGERGGTITTTTTPPVGTTGTVGTQTTRQTGAVFPPGSAVMARPRMSQIIGSNVYNEENNSIGSVDDIILVPPTGAGQDGPIAVLQVGGFLGIGGRLVAVSLGDVQWNTERERLVLPGVTADSLRAQAEFRYDSIRPR